MCFSSRSASRATGSPQSSVRAGATGKNCGVVVWGAGCMAIENWPPRAAAQSNPLRNGFLAPPRSGFERRLAPEVAVHAETVALQLGPGERLEAPQIPVLGGVARIGEQLVV